MGSFRSSKYLKTTVELTFTTQKARSPWTTCSVFDWKTQNYQFKLKFCTQTNSNMQNPMVIFTFSVFD